MVVGTSAESHLHIQDGKAIIDYDLTVTNAMSESENYSDRSGVIGVLRNCPQLEAIYFAITYFVLRST
jgi:hypothetical protein